MCMCVCMSVCVCMYSVCVCVCVCGTMLEGGRDLNLKAMLRFYFVKSDICISTCACLYVYECVCVYVCCVLDTQGSEMRIKSR